MNKNRETHDALLDLRDAALDFCDAIRDFMNSPGIQRRFEAGVNLLQFFAVAAFVFVAVLLGLDKLGIFETRLQLVLVAAPVFFVAMKLLDKLFATVLRLFLK